MIAYKCVYCVYHPCPPMVFYMLHLSIYIHMKVDMAYMEDPGVIILIATTIENNP